MANILEALSPVQVLEKLYAMDRTSAAFLAGGIGVFAAAAIIVAWNIDVHTMALICLYVIGMSLLLAICVALPPLLKHTLGTVLVLTIVNTVMLFFAAVVWEWPKPSYCLAKFWLRCEEAAAQTAQQNATTLDAKVEVPQAISLPPILTTAIVSSHSIDARLVRGVSADKRATPTDIGSLPSSIPSPSPVPAPNAQPVFIQFAGLITRESIKSLNAALRRGGWNVQSSSGERQAAAAGLNEVRYSSPEFHLAAQTLADAVTATKISAQPVTVRLTPKVGPNLELWISN